jgi:hypothetical protein
MVLNWDSTGSRHISDNNPSSNDDEQLVFGDRFDGLDISGSRDGDHVGGFDWDVFDVQIRVFTKTESKWLSKQFCLLSARSQYQCTISEMRCSLGSS